MGAETQVATPPAAIAPPPAAPAADVAAPGAALGAPPAAEAAKPAEVTKPAAAAAPAETKPAPVLVDAKWAPKAIDGTTRDAAVMTKSAELFTKLGLNTEQAQALVDYSDELGKASSAAQDKALETQLGQQHAGWWKELQADKDIGGAQFNENLSAARKAVKALFGEQGHKELEAMGLTNWPPLVKAMIRAGKSISEDTIRDSTRPAAVTDGELAALKRSYPNSPELWDPQNPAFKRS